MENYAELIKRWRDSVPWTQEELAQKLGYPDNKNVSRWETGEATPYQQNVRRLARAFGVSVDDFKAGPQSVKNYQRESRTPRATFDLDGITYVYLLSDLKQDVTKSRVVAFLFSHQAEINPKAWFDVIVDMDGHLFPRKTKVSICRTRTPKPGDVVLVWDKNKGPRFVKWSETDKPERYESYYGPVTDVQVA